MSANIVIIAALNREVAPLIINWRKDSAGLPDGCSCYINGNAALLCAGIGYSAARRAAEAAIQRYQPDLLISAGLAGALVPDVKVGEVFEPSTVIDAASGKRYSTEGGHGTLVTAGNVAGIESKKALGQQFRAEIVDMEAAAVADVAERRGIPLTVVKAISDELEFELPDLAPFINPEGRFQMRKFVGHLALRPRLWGTVLRLGSNSNKASANLCAHLRRVIEESSHEHQTPLSGGKESRSR